MQLSKNPIAGFAPCPECQQLGTVHFPKGGTRANSPYLFCPEHGSKNQSIPKAYFVEHGVDRIEQASEHIKADAIRALMAQHPDVAITHSLTQRLSQSDPVTPLQEEVLPTQPEPLSEHHKEASIMKQTITVDNDTGEEVKTPVAPPSDDSEPKSSGLATALWWVLGIGVCGGALYGGYRWYQHERAKWNKV